MELRGPVPTRKIKWGDKVLAEFGYGVVNPLGTRKVHHREVAVTGAPSGAVVADWPVTWVDGMRGLDGDGRIGLRPGEGILLGLEPGKPLWFIPGDDLEGRFYRSDGKGRAIYVTDSDLIQR